MATPPPPPRPRRGGREIHTTGEFDAALARPGGLAGLRIQSVDLTDRTFALLTASTATTVFLGCLMEPEAAAKVGADGALVFPPVPGLPFDPYRNRLYTPDELYEGVTGPGGYQDTPDALREDGLLARSTAGVVFLPGAAGTVQEIFDAATPNYYDAPGTPLVLVDRSHWTTRLPAWPLLEALAGNRPMATRVALVDSVDEAPAALARLGAA